MANALYDYGREGFLAKDIGWDDDDIKVMLVRIAAGSGAGGNTVYTFSAAHQFLSDIPANSYCRVAASANLSGKTVTGGVANAATVTFSTVALGDPIGALVIYKDTTVDATSRLIAYIDVATGAPGLPITPNGGSIAINWDTGANKIFKL